MYFPKLGSDMFKVKPKVKKISSRSNEISFVTYLFSQLEVYSRTLETVGVENGTYWVRRSCAG